MHDDIKPVFIELSSDNLLPKWLQNSNELLHSIIWVRWPKNVFVESQTLEIGVYSAVIEINEPYQSNHKVKAYMGLDTGSQLITKSRQWNSVHVRKMVKKCSEKGKKRRETLRGLKKGHINKERHINKEKELEPKESYIEDGH